MAKPKTRADQPLLQIVEEATELLRRADMNTWVWWFAGTMPFVCGLLHYVSDMSRAASAWDRLPGASLTMGLLYWWMKVAQAVFSDRLLRQLRGGEQAEKMSKRAWLRFVTSQAMIHCTASFTLPLSLLAMLPFGWMYAAFHNVSVLALSHFRQGGRTRDLMRVAVVQSNYRQGQNHGLMLILLTFASIVWLNCFLGVLLMVQLAKAVTGVESEFTRIPWTLLSSALYATTIMASYLIVGPLVKSVYVLRCFYSLSRKNGEDLIVAFRRAAAPALALITAVLFFAAGSSLQAAPEAAVAPVVAENPGVKADPAQLDRNIREVLQREAFQWRLPREEKREDKDRGWIASFLKSVGEWLDKAGKWVSETFDKLLVEKIKEWLRQLRHGPNFDDAPTTAAAWAESAQLVLKVLLIVLGLIIVVMLIRFLRRTPPAKATAAVAAMPEVNLDSDHIIASQLPENEWLRLAQEKIDSGDYRLAMRAFFLATLAHLGERKLLMIRKSKSNGDYVRELALRARDRNDLRGMFTDSVRTFDWAWYGWHDVTRDLLDQFRTNHQHIVSDGVPR